jgi:hypothetical protein
LKRLRDLTQNLASNWVEFSLKKKVVGFGTGNPLAYARWPRKYRSLVLTSP